MYKKKPFRIGDPHIVFYQKVVFLIGLLLILFLLAIGYFLQENYIFSIALAASIGWLIIVYLYSNVFEVELTGSSFRIRNIFRSFQIDSKKFKEIKRIYFISFLMVIVFDDRKFYFLMKSKDLINDFIFYDNEYERALNQKIIEKIKMIEIIDGE